MSILYKQCAAGALALCLLYLSASIYFGNGKDLPVFVYCIGIVASAINSVLGIGFQPVSAAPRHQGYFSQEQVVDAYTERSLREINLGQFLAGEVWSLRKNLTVLELGCGRGQLTYNLNSVPGVRCLGLDGYKGIRQLGDTYRQWDLQQFFRMEDVDFTVSIEVGEHIPNVYEENFFRTLLQAKHGIILAWATPGQAGHGHVNGHWQSFLRRRIEGENRHRYCLALSHQLVQGFSHQGFHSLWEYRNLMVFVDKESDHICDMPLRDFVEILCTVLLLTLLLAAALMTHSAWASGALQASSASLCRPYAHRARLPFPIAGKVATV
mmetsp:Transcript_35096/g.80852  ORF Transcript_35096/g.80852 Transcript_35096/m.80852 type:complete len:324 (-) Transcript_35096:306-1277(-)